MIMPLRRLFSFSVGVIKYEPIRRAKYFVTVINTFSVYSLIRFIYPKSNADNARIDIVNKLKCLFNARFVTPTITIRSAFK